LAVTATVEAENEAEEAPAGTATEAGTAIEVLFAESATAAPVVEAAEDRVTVQALGEPPFTEAGAHTREETVGDGVTGGTGGSDAAPEVTMNSPMTSSELSYPPKV
jgi:hypothetical protein